MVNVNKYKSYCIILLLYKDEKIINKIDLKYIYKYNIIQILYK